MKRIRTLTLLITATCLLNTFFPVAASAAEVIVAEWNFPDDTANEFADDGIAANNGIATISTMGGTEAIGFTQAGDSTRAANATGWNNGVGEKAWRVGFVTTGYHGLRVSSKQRSSNTAPRDFKLQYSLNGEDWTDVANVPELANDFVAGVLVDQPLPEAVDDQSSVYLRWIMTSNISVNEDTVGGMGNSRIDDIVISVPPPPDPSGIDPSNAHAWGENVGWLNAAPEPPDVVVHFDGDAGWLSGHVWGENIGWVRLGATAGGPYGNSATDNWGVNIDDNGNLSGFAWGENVGWINFGPAFGGVTINTANGGFSGHAWGENIGWVSFNGASPDYGVRTLAFDTQEQGTPNWWLAHHDVDEDHDAGDGMPAWRKYVMDVDPHVEGSGLRIESVDRTASGTEVTFWPASTRRYYTLIRRTNLVDGAWTPVAGQADVPGSGGADALADADEDGMAIYGVEVKVTP